MSATDEVARADAAGHIDLDDTPSGKRKLVVFADGVGNAFSTQESTIWRLYESLDHTSPDQISHYIKGTGTAGWAPLAALDFATGVGVPSNVRKLYRFLCWNWRPGDEIYIFGFGRGAFTARTLAAMISSQGLVPAEIDGLPVSSADMERNTMAAWREYRRQSVPFQKSLPTIWITRLIRDVLLYLYHLVFAHRSYAEVRQHMEDRKEIEIEFLGLFDTVEAFGVPVEELRVAIDWAIWPISFRSHRPSRKVKHICHALALDDERTTFHPLRIDQSDLPLEQIVKEVWFAGVHSDIGGGYPDCSLSFVPLVWMVEQLRGKLRFHSGTIEHFRAYQSAIGPMHDSRRGAAMLYRYGPRHIGNSARDGGPPVVHFAVVERMLRGSDDYAPVMLPANAWVYLPNGDTKALRESSGREAMKAAYLVPATDHWREEEAEAFVQMKAPDSEMSAVVQDTVWWRRVAYFALLYMIGVIAIWPWIVRSLVRVSADDSLQDTRTLSVITDIDWTLGEVIGPVVHLVRSVLPDYASPWLDISLYYPFLTSIVATLTLWVWYRYAELRDAIQVRARLAWNGPHRKRSPSDSDLRAFLLRFARLVGYQENSERAHTFRPGPLLKFARFMRQHGNPARVLFARLLMPAVFFLIASSLVTISISRGIFAWHSASGRVCTSPIVSGSPNGRYEQAVGTPVLDAPIDARAPFNTRDFCWWSGLAVEKGRKYLVWIEIKEPWFDRTVMTGANGFQTYSLSYNLALPFRRLFGADWFQPVVRVGSNGRNDLPLYAVNVMPADELPRRLNPTIPAEMDRDNSKSRYPVRVEDTMELPDPTDREKLKKLKDDVARMSTFDALPASETARTVWDAQKLENRLVAEFVAPDAGDLFFYVNDAVQFYPNLVPAWLRPASLAAIQGPYDQFYKNNAGTARIVVQRLPSPPMPPELPSAAKP
ncbi:hypothetical protein SE92_20325 [Bradyrhizobium sp. AT1]|nr:hypothetical protein SE92_20325 [Bradyrhizobium sp. AT1]